VEVDRSTFLDFRSLRCSAHEDEVTTIVVLRTASDPLVHKKGKNGRKIFKY
jgi:hypothetical protein